MKLLIGIQARTGSQRFPGKILEYIGDKTILERIYDTCMRSADFIGQSGAEVMVRVLGVTDDTRLRDYCDVHGFKCMFPPANEDDLVSRYFKAACHVNASHVIRVTGDCWAIPQDALISCFEALMGADYASNTMIRSFPEGWDVQGCSIRALAWFNRNQRTEREHLFAPFDDNKIVRDRFRDAGLHIAVIYDGSNPMFMQTSIDTREDLEIARECEATPNNSRRDVLDGPYKWKVLMK